MRHSINRFIKTKRTCSLKQIVKTGLLFFIVYSFIIYILLEVLWFHQKSRYKSGSLVLPYVVVHLDLKGGPPKLTYLENLLPSLRKMGANGLLIEYEDMFPYDGRLVNLSSTKSYKKSDLQAFVMTAVNSGFEIIPLIQTFGHLEYALKLEEFQHLRENTASPDSICPSQMQSRNFIHEMVQQVMDFHKEISPLKYIHIGCDEVYNINTCTFCQRREKTSEDIFLQHVIATSRDIKNSNPNITVLIWDDMLRDMKQSLNGYNLHLYVEPVYWSYHDDLKISHMALHNYYKHFNNIWIASAFKGADGRTSVQPDLNRRFKNHYAWMRLIHGYNFGIGKPVQFKGIFLTGWSRYGHFDPLCDLLPTSVPSLYLNLLFINELKNSNMNVSVALKKSSKDFFDNYLEDNLREALGCSSKVNMDLEHFNSSNCNFNENEVYNILSNFKIKDESKYGFNIYLLNYYLSKNMVNPIIIEDVYDSYNNWLEKIVAFEEAMYRLLKPYYEYYVIQEIVSYRTKIFKNVINETTNDLLRYLNVKTWKRN